MPWSLYCNRTNYFSDPVNIHIITPFAIIHNLVPLENSEHSCNQWFYNLDQKFSKASHTSLVVWKQKFPGEKWIIMSPLSISLFRFHIFTGHCHCLHSIRSIPVLVLCLLRMPFSSACYEKHGRLKVKESNRGTNVLLHKTCFQYFSSIG